MVAASGSDKRGRSRNVSGSSGGGGNGGGDDSDGDWCILDGVDGGGGGWDGGWDHDNRGGKVWGDEWHDGCCS